MIVSRMIPFICDGPAERVRHKRPWRMRDLMSLILESRIRSRTKWTARGAISGLFPSWSGSSFSSHRIYRVLWAKALLKISLAYLIGPVSYSASFLWPRVFLVTLSFAALFCLTLITKIALISKVQSALLNGFGAAGD